MKKNIFIIPMVALLLSCAPKDKQSQLDALKAKRDGLENQIATLEEGMQKEGLIKHEENPINVKILDVTSCTFKHYVEVQGKVDGDQNVSVSPQTPGIVTAVYHNQGDFVHKGEVLAEIDSKVLQQSIQEVETQYELANLVYLKQKALWDKKIGSEIQYLQAKTNKESLENRMKTLNEQLDMTKITSPIDGTIEDNPLKVGQLASPGVPTSSIRVINMNAAKIKAEVAESYSSKIRKGDNVIVKFPDNGKQIESKLNFTSKFIDPTNRTFTVECRVSAKDVELRANMIAYLDINDYTNENAFCVPVNMIQQGSSGKYVIVAVQKEGFWYAEEKPITTGSIYDGTAEVTTGLNLGDKIITSGYQYLKQGQKIIF